MVTLKVTGNIREDVAKLDYQQLAQIRQAQYYIQKGIELKNSVVFGGKFNSNNPDWTCALQAVNNFVWNDHDVKTEIIFEEK